MLTCNTFDNAEKGEYILLLSIWAKTVVQLKSINNGSSLNLTFPSWKAVHWFIRDDYMFMVDWLTNGKYSDWIGVMIIARVQKSGVTPNWLEWANFNLILKMEHAQQIMSSLLCALVQSAVERVIDQIVQYLHLTGGRGSSQWLNHITIINRRSSPHLKVLNNKFYFLNQKYRHHYGHRWHWTQ